MTNTCFYRYARHKDGATSQIGRCDYEVSHVGIDGLTLGEPGDSGERHHGLLKRGVIWTCFNCFLSANTRTLPIAARNAGNLQCLGQDASNAILVTSETDVGCTADQAGSTLYHGASVKS